MPRIRSSRRLPRALVILSLGLVALASGCAGLQSMEPPEVSVVNLRPVGGTLMEQRFQFFYGMMFLFFEGVFHSFYAG